MLNLVKTKKNLKFVRNIGEIDRNNRFWSQRSVLLQHVSVIHPFSVRCDFIELQDLAERDRDLASRTNYW